MSDFIRNILIVPVLALMYVSVFASDQRKISDVNPSLVFSTLNKTELKLIQIGRHMGVKQNVCSLVQAKNVSPREVYFQAVRLENKINELLLELTGEKSYAINNLNGFNTINLSPYDVLQVIERININLDVLSKRFNIDVTYSENMIFKGKTPSDVYQKILSVNNYVNELLDTRASVSDVYETTNLSVYYALEIFHKTNIKVDDLERTHNAKFKTIEDIFKQQVDIIKRLEAIFKLLNLKMLTLAPAVCRKTISTNELQELSYLIISEFHYLADIKKIPLKNIRNYYPGKKFPSDVFNRNLDLLRLINESIKNIEVHIKRKVNVSKKRH